MNVPCCLESLDMLLHYFTGSSSMLGHVCLSKCSPTPRPYVEELQKIPIPEVLDAQYERFPMEEVSCCPCFVV